MNKEQLKNIVDRTYATWNQTIPTPQTKTIYNAWWTLLHDLDPTETETTITQLATTETYMPRPGQIRRHTLNRINNWDPPEDLEAWAQLRTMAQAAHTGTEHTTPIHPTIKTTVQKIGTELAYNLHTNQDREHFLKLYRKCILNHETQQLTPKEPQP